MGPGATCTFDVTVTVPPGAADGSYINVTSNLSITSPSTISLSPAVDALTVDSNRLQLTKEFTDDPVPPGGTVTLEFTLTNLDTLNAASSIDFTDDLGAALTGLTFTSLVSNNCGGTVSGTGTDTLTLSGCALGAGASCMIGASVTVPGLASVGTVTNTTSGVTGTISGLAATGDPASDDLIIATLDFSKSFDGPTTAGGTPMLTFTVTNLDTSSSVSDLAFSDDLDNVIMGLVATSLPATPCGAGSTLAGTSILTLPGGSLGPGASCMFDVDLVVPAGASAGSFARSLSAPTVRSPSRSTTQLVPWRLPAWRLPTRCPSVSWWPRPTAPSRLAVAP